VRQRSSPAFRDQRRRFTLRFTCEHCSYFHVETERCTHGYPTAVHRAERYEQPAEDAELVFCKDFDLW